MLKGYELTKDPLRHKMVTLIFKRVYSVKSYHSELKHIGLYNRIYFVLGV